MLFLLDLLKYYYLYFKVFMSAFWLALSSRDKSLRFLQSFSWRAAREIVLSGQINDAIDVMILRVGCDTSAISVQEVEDLRAIGFDKSLSIFRCIRRYGSVIPQGFIGAMRILHEKMPQEEPIYLRYLNSKKPGRIISFIIYLPDFSKILTRISDKETFTPHEFEELMLFFINCCDRERSMSTEILSNLRQMLETWEENNLPIQITYALFTKIYASNVNLAREISRFSQWCLGAKRSLLTQQILNEIAEKSPGQGFIALLEQTHELALTDLLMPEHLSLMLPPKPEFREPRNQQLQVIRDILPKWVQSMLIERLDAQRYMQLLAASQSSLDNFNCYLSWIISAGKIEHCTGKVLDWYLAPQESSFHRYLNESFSFLRIMSWGSNPANDERFNIFLDLVEMKAEQEWENVARHICIAISEPEMKEIVWYWNIVKKTGQLHQFNNRCVTHLFNMVSSIEAVNNLLKQYMIYQEQSPLNIDDLKSIIATPYDYDTLSQVFAQIHKIFKHKPEAMTQQLFMRFFNEDMSEAFPDFIEQCEQGNLWDAVTTEDLIQVFEYSYDSDSDYDDQGTNYHCKVLKIMHEQSWGPKISSENLKNLLSLKGRQVKDLVAMLEFFRDKEWLAMINPDSFNIWVCSGRLESMAGFFQLILKKWSSKFNDDEKRDLIIRLAENFTQADRIRKIFLSLLTLKEKEYVSGELINTLLNFKSPQQLQGVLVFLEIFKKIGMSDKFPELLPEDPHLYTRAKVMGQVICDVCRAERPSGFNPREERLITLKGSDRYPIAAAIYPSVATLDESELSLVLDFLYKLHAVGTEYFSLELITAVLKNPRLIARFFINIYSINNEALQIDFQTHKWESLIEKKGFNEICTICQEFYNRSVFLSTDEINNLYDCQDALALQEMKMSLLLENAPDYELETRYKNIHSLLKLMKLYRSKHVSYRGGIVQIRDTLRKFVSLMITHSQHLDLYEVIAERYLDGCVNQPVRGFSEICAYLHIAEAKGDLNSKIQAFRYLYALTMVQSYVGDHQPEESFEAEAANALISRVYLHWLSKSIDQSTWLGIPAKIVNYGGVHQWLLVYEQDFEPIKQKICSATTNDLKDFAINQTSVWLWAPILFPKEAASLKEQHEQLVTYMTIESEYQNHQEAERAALSFETFIESYNLNDATKELYLSKHQQSSMNLKDMTRAYQELRFIYHNDVSMMACSKIDPTLPMESATIEQCPYNQRKMRT